MRNIKDLTNSYNKILTLPICGRIVAVINKEIIVQFHKYVQGDATIGCQDIVISLFHHTIKVIQSQVLAEHFVTNAISLQKPFKFLQEYRGNGSLHCG